MKKHSSKLKAQTVKDGTEPAISLNPVLSAAAIHQHKAHLETVTFFIKTF